MLHTLARNWWALALRGLVAVLFGLLTFILPGITLVTLVLLFGAYALVDGIFNVIAFFRVASHHWALLIEGVIGIIAGVLTFAWPAITAIVLLYLISFWAIFTGVFETIAGIRLRKAIVKRMGHGRNRCAVACVRRADSVCTRCRCAGDCFVDRSVCDGVWDRSYGVGIPSTEPSTPNCATYVARSAAEQQSGMATSKPGDLADTGEVVTVRCQNRAEHGQREQRREVGW